jgi:phage tail protein X
MTGRYDTGTPAVLPPDPALPAPAGGTPVGTAYLLPRVPPPHAAGIALARHRVEVGDRLDLIAFRYYGDPAGAWQICDANAALDPDDLVGPAAVGTVIVIPAPRPEL